MKMKPDTMPTTTAVRRPARPASLAIPLAIGLSALAAGCDSTATGSDAGGGGVQATFTSLYGDYLGECKQCHSPAGPGRTPEIEQTLDFTTRATAYTTLSSTASGLMGNHTGCNGVKFIMGTPASSLLVATLDQATRTAFDVSASPNCDADAISDETVKVGSQPSAEFMTALRSWITSGAPNN